MKLSYVLIAAAVLLSACSKSRKAPNGLELKVVREGEGNYAAPGQYVVMNMVYKDAKDSVWDDSRKRPVPMVFQVPDTSLIKQELGIESVFRILKKGDSLMAKVSAQSFFMNSLKQPVPPNVKAESEFTFYFGVTEVTGEQGINALMQKIQTREYEKSRMNQEGQLATDTLAIDAYLADKKIDAIKDKSGVRYVITKASTGNKPTIESTLTFAYKGSFIETGEVFDQSTSPVVYPLSQLIRGWQIVFPLFAKGTKATLYVPSSLGYGASGMPPRIPGNANLVFEVELIDFK